MHIRCTLKHIETHYNQGNFYVVVATITTMCFNVFQCAKKHIENTLRHIERTLQTNVFWTHCEIRKQHIAKHIVARAHCGTHWEIPMCPMCRAAQCARNTLKHITTHWNTLAYYLIWRGVQIKWLAQDARNFGGNCGMPPVPNWWSRWKVHLKVRMASASVWAKDFFSESFSAGIVGYRPQIIDCRS